MLKFRPFGPIAAPLLALACASCAAPMQGPVASAPVAPAPAAPQQRAKNVILFIGDGMGISTITAARIYDGQSRGETGEENSLSFETFPGVALVKTYNTDQQVPDSAGTASAMNSGVKTRAGVINTGPAAHRGDCAEGLANRLPTVAEEAHARGKAIGVVSTARLTHATPAAVYGHAPERDWEGDAEIPEAERATGCKDFAAQLVDFPFDVALGGGARYFFGKDKGGKRIGPDADLPAAWTGRTDGHYVTSRGAMETAPAGPLLGLFSSSHMTYMLNRKPDTTEPTLTEMTKAAISRLATKSGGYFLMVEGGRIDHGHHDGKAAYALSETQELSRAVQAAVDATDPDDTLILVTADHSHVFTIAGYPTRGNPILGLVIGNDERGNPKTEPTLALDRKPYATLGYQNGPGAVRGERPVPSTGPAATQQALVPTGYESDGTPAPNETHGGEDVALFARGPGAQRAHGVIEQNAIHDIITAAFGFER